MMAAVNYVNLSEYFYQRRMQMIEIDVCLSAQLHRVNLESTSDSVNCVYNLSRKCV